MYRAKPASGAILYHRLRRWQRLPHRSALVMVPTTVTMIGAIDWSQLASDTVRCSYPVVIAIVVSNQLRPALAAAA